MMHTVYVPSMSRATKVVTRIPGMTLVVPRKQVREYERHNSCHVIGHPPLQNIGQVRQWIIDNAPHPTVTMCDDDVKFFKRIDGKLHRTEDPTEGIEILQDAIDLYGYGMASIGMRLWNNTKPNYVNYGHCHTVWAIDRNLAEKIPEECAVNEDLFLAMSLAIRGIPNLVVNCWAQESGAGGQPGGCAEYRNGEIQNRANSYLAKRFHPYIKINPNPKAVQHSVRVYWKRLANEI